jgi:hypothetical protein
MMIDSNTSCNSESVVGNKDGVPIVESNLTNDKLVLNLISHTDAIVDSKFLLQNNDINPLIHRKKQMQVSLFCCEIKP